MYNFTSLGFTPSDAGSSLEESDGSAADFVQSLPSPLMSQSAYKSPSSLSSPGKSKVPPPSVSPKPNARRQSDGFLAQCKWKWVQCTYHVVFCCLLRYDMCRL